MNTYVERQTNSDWERTCQGMNSSFLRQINDLYFKIQNLCNELCYFLLFDYNVIYLTDFLY